MSALKNVNLTDWSRQGAVSKEIFGRLIPARIIRVALGGKEAGIGWNKKNEESAVIDTVVDGFPNGHSNYGAVMPPEFYDLDIDCKHDTFFAVCIEAGLRFARVPVEFAWGRPSRTYGGKIVPSHIVIHAKNDVDDIKRFEPPKRHLNGGLAHVQFRHTPEDKDAITDIHQTVIPPSIYDNKDGTTDLLTWVQHKTATTPVITLLSSALRGVAIGNLLYILRDHWVRGNRHDFSLAFGGWLARRVRDAQRIESDPSDPLHGVVLTAIRTEEEAVEFIRLVCRFYEADDDDETHDRVRGLRNAFRRLDLGANVPGDVALSDAMKSSDIVRAMNSLVVMGAGLNSVHDLHNDLILEVTDEGILYVIRSRFNKGLSTFRLPRESVRNLFTGKKVRLGSKLVSAFDLYEASEKREEATGGCSIYPDDASGELLLMRNGVVLPDDYEGDMKGVLKVYNTWNGFGTATNKHPDTARGERVIELFYWVLGNLTRDNSKQVEYVVKWLADIIQNPGSKMPICLVSTGGKGWGKSTLFNEIYPRLIGATYSGRITNSILSSRFPIDSYKDKLFMSFNEAKALKDEDKTTFGNFVKDVDVAGEGKGIKASNYKNLARTVVTTNSFEFNITAKGSPRGEPERALYYIRCWDMATKKMSQEEYKNHRASLQSTFDDLRSINSSGADLEHLMWFLSSYKYQRDDLLDLSSSSISDPDIAEQNLDWPTAALRLLFTENKFGSIERAYGTVPAGDQGAAWPCPFTVLDIRNILDAYVRVESRYSVNAADVISIMLDLGLVEKRGAFYLPIKQYGTAIRLIENATGVPIVPSRDLTDEDFGDVNPQAKWAHLLSNKR